MPYRRRRIRKRLIVRRRTLKRLAILIAVAVPVGLAIRYVDWGPSKAQLLKRGDQFVEKKQDAEAIIEYRRALQKDANDGAARAKLALAYTRTGDARNALRETVVAADLLPYDGDQQLRASQFLLLARRYEDARTRVERALAITPNNVTAQLLKGSISAGLKDPESAIAEINDAIRMNPRDARSYTVMGDVQLSMGRHAEAEAAFRRAIETEPASPLVWMALANFYLSVGRPAEAEPLLKRASELDPKNVATQRALATYYTASGQAKLAEAPLKAVAEILDDVPSRLALADLYFADQRTNEARTLLTGIAADPRGFGMATVRLAAMDYSEKRVDAANLKLRQVIAKEPKNIDALLLKARFLVAEKKVDEALATVKSATVADPRSALALSALATIYEGRGASDEAITALNDILKLNPKSVATKLRLADVHLHRGELRTSIQVAREVLRELPKHSGARLLLGRALTANGDIAEAATVLGQLLRESPDIAELHAQMGVVFMMKHDRASARREFERALELKPDSIEALGGRLGLDVEEGNVQRARETIEQQVKKTPSEPRVIALAAATYEALGDVPGQEASLRRLIDIDPANLEAYGSLGFLYARQHRLEEAKASYETMAARLPTSLTAQTMIAVLLHVQQRYDEAQKAYEKVLAMYPRAGLPANNLAWLYAERGGNLDVALQLAQTAKQQMPEAPQVNDTLGWVYYKKDLAALAIPALKTSIQGNPHSPLYRYHLGLAYTKAGDKLKAIESFDEALKQKPDYREADDARRQLIATLAASASTAGRTVMP